MNNFSLTLNNSINECIESNANLSICNVKFTYNFSLLLERLNMLRSSYIYDFTSIPNAAVVSEFMYAIASMTRSKLNATLAVNRGLMEETLRNTDRNVIGLDSMAYSDIMFCEKNLSDLNLCVQNTINVLCNGNFCNFQRTRSAKFLKEIDLLVQNCLEDINSVVEEVRQPNPNQNRVPRRLSNVELRAAYFADLYQATDAAHNANAR